MVPRNIFILWLQGWQHAPWLTQRVAESWRLNNPEWKVHFLDFHNLLNYVDDIDYIYDTDKTISPQAMSDIIRLSILNKHGDVWADATMLCMQPLEHWVHEATEPAGLWMYHGDGAGLMPAYGPAIWFIVSLPNGTMIRKWKAQCDEFWNANAKTNIYFTLDTFFVQLFQTDPEFRQLWTKVPYLYCELDGQAHCLASHGMEGNTPHIKRLFETKPPYALKFWKRWHEIFPDVTVPQCTQSNGFCAIELAARKYCYKHSLTQPSTAPSQLIP